MNLLSPFLTLNCSCEESLQWTEIQFSQAGLRAIRTFDLRETVHHVSGDCPYPKHGSEKCDCRMIVLLVYGNEKDPVTLILHGSNGQTWLSLVQPADQKTNMTTLSSIRNVLEAKQPAEQLNSI